MQSRWYGRFGLFAEGAARRVVSVRMVQMLTCALNLRTRKTFLVPKAERKHETEKSAGAGDAGAADGEASDDDQSEDGT